MALDPATMIEKLELALSKGLLEIEVEGERMRYASASDLRSRIAYWEAKARTAQSGVTPAVGTTYAAFERD